MTTTTHAPVFPNAPFATHMPFLRDDTMLFCGAQAPRSHTFECGGTIWGQIAANPKLQAHFANLPRTQTIAFCRWKLHAAEWHSRQYRPLPTGLPEGAVECSPSFYVQDGLYHISFIGGIPKSHGIEYRLYQMSGPALNQMGPASVVSARPARIGFVGPRYVCTPIGSTFSLRDRQAGTEIQLACPLRRVRFVNYRADNDQTLIITGQDESNQIATLLYQIDTDETSVVQTPEGAYKPSLFGQRIVFAKRLSRGHEDRELWHGPIALAKAATPIRRVAHNPQMQSPSIA